MTLKTSYKNLYRLEAKRNMFLTCLNGFAIFLALPFFFIQQVVTFGSDYGVAFKYASKNLLQERIIRLTNVTYGNVLLLTVLIGLAVLNGIVLYSYLSDRAKQDFYYSMPVKKASFFWLGYKQGIVNIALPLCMNLVIMFILAAVNDCLTIGFISVLLYVSFVGFLIYCACFGVTLLGCVLTGRMLFHILGAVTLLAYAPVVYAVLEYMVDGRLQCLDTIFKYLYLMSPASAALWFFGEAGNFNINSAQTDIKLEYIGVASVAALLVIALVSLAVTRVLYEKRSASDTGKTVVFKQAKKVIKGFLVVILTLLGSMMISSMYDMNSMTYKIIGAVFGFLLGTYLVDIMLELNWKGNIRNWKGQIVYMAIAAAAFASVLGFQEYHRYKGFDDIKTNYTIEQAVADNCVLLDENTGYYSDETFDGSIRGTQVYKKAEGVESFDKFVEDVALGKESKVRLVSYWSLEDYDSYNIQDLVYKDGEIKRYDLYSRFGSAYEFKYLVRLTGKLAPEDKERVYYVLTNQKDYSFEDFKKYQTDWNIAYNEADCVLSYDIEEGKEAE